MRSEGVSVPNPAYTESGAVLLSYSGVEKESQLLTVEKCSTQCEVTRIDVSVYYATNLWDIS